MLTLISTPIGNLQDISPRAMQAIESADLLACEDTRQTQKLIMLLGIKIKAHLISYHDHNGEVARPRILKALEKGQKVGLLSDAGTPLISDPGYKLVRDAMQKNIPVTATPGACAPILALILSGLPTDRFLFHGFFPDKQKTAHSWLEECKNLSVTSIFFVSPSRLGACVSLLHNLWGDRPAALVREITKLHEEVISLSLKDMSETYQNAPAPKGELVLVIAPPTKIDEYSDEDIDHLLTTRLTDLSLKDAVQEVASLTGKPRKQIYQKALDIAKHTPDT